MMAIDTMISRTLTYGSHRAPCLRTTQIHVDTNEASTCHDVANDDMLHNIHSHMKFLSANWQQPHDRSILLENEPDQSNSNYAN